MMHMINYEVVHIVLSLIIVRRILTFVISCYTLYDTLEYMKYKKFYLTSIIFYVYEERCYRFIDFVGYKMMLEITPHQKQS